MFWSARRCLRDEEEVDAAEYHDDESEGGYYQNLLLGKKSKK